MGYMVRRALRGRRVRSPFARRVLAEVAAAGPAGPGQDLAKRDELIDQITSRICEDVLRNLCSDSESHQLSALLLAAGRTDEERDNRAELASARKGVSRQGRPTCSGFPIFRLY